MVPIWKDISLWFKDKRTIKVRRIFVKKLTILETFFKREKRKKKGSFQSGDCPKAYKQRSETKRFMLPQDNDTRVPLPYFFYFDVLMNGAKKAITDGPTARQLQENEDNALRLCQ